MNKFLLILVLILSFCGFAQEGPKLETILQKGHSKYVTSADIHPSGKYAVTGGFDNTIILWNIETGKEIRMFNRHTNSVWSVVFSPDGSQILSTSADQTTKLYDVLTGNLVHNWPNSKDDIRQAYFSPKGAYVITVDNRDGLKVFDRVTGKPVGDYQKNYSAFYQRSIIDPTETKILNTSGYKGAEVLDIKTGDTLLSIPFDKVFGMAFSPDGSKISLSSSKQFAKIFDAKTGKELFHLEDPDSDEQCDGCHWNQVWSHSGKYLLTMSNKIDAILWDATTGKKIRSFNEERERPTIIKFSPDDSHVLILLDGTLYAYQTSSGKLTMQHNGEKLDYYEVNFAPTGNTIILPAENNSVEVWNVATGAKSTTLKGYLNHQRDDGLKYSYDNWTDSGILKYVSMRRSFALSPDNKSIVIGSIDSTALQIDLVTGKVIKEFKGHSKVVIAFDFSPDGKTLATAGGDRTIKLWDVATGKEMLTLSGHRNLVFDISFNSDGTKLSSASWDGTLGVWDLVNETYVLKDLGGNAPYRIDFAPNDLYILTGDLKNQLDFWEADALESFRGLVGNTGIVGDFDFSPDGSLLATSSWDGKVKVWNMLTGMQVARMANHDGPVYSVAWDPKGRFVASGGADNIILLWDVENNKVIKELKGHNNAVSWIEITSDGDLLVSCSVEGVIKVWNLNTFEEKFSRIQINRSEWLTTSPTGYFDGSSKALGLVNYVSGLEVIPVGSLFDKYFAPGLIKRINAGEKFADAGQQIKSLIESSPLIAFQFSESNRRSIPIEIDSVYQWKKAMLPLGLKINSQDQELAEIRIYNNGKLIIAETLNENLVFRGGEKDVRNYEVPLSDGKNEITGLVVNKNRTESSPTSIIVEYDGEAAQTDLYILSIGINKYKNPQYNLDYAVNDSKSFTSIIVAGGDSLFREVHEYSIINENATKEIIEATILEIKSKIGPEDVFLFYYAGHGVMSYEKNPEDSDFYIVTHDVINLYGDAQLLKEKAISAKELMQYSMEISAEKQLFVLDACHSGGALNSFATRGDGREKALAQLARSTGTFFLTASQDAQYANEVGNLEHGLFTYALLEVLGGELGNNGDNKVTINEIKSYVEDRVPELSEEYRGSPQYPTSYSFGQDFPIVILK